MFGRRDSAPASRGPSVRNSAEMPVAVVLAAGGSVAHAPGAVAPHAFLEIAAQIRAVLVFAHRREIAVVAARVAPFVALADGAVEAVGIDAEGVAAVFAIHVAGDLIAGHAAQEDAADGGRRAPAATAELAADDAAGDGADDGARRGVLLVAVLAVIIALG